MTPDQIVNHRFKQALRGYAVGEVDDLLDRLAEQVERTEADLDRSREQLREAEASAATAKETEATLQRTLVVAQQAADRTIADAEAAARTTREQADAEAARVRADAEAHAARTFEEVQTAARREVDAARARVDEAARRYRQLLADVAAHRDELHVRLRGLDEIATELPSPPPPSELVAGELDPSPATGWATSDQPDASVDGPGASRDRPGAPLDRPGASLDRPGASLDDETAERTVGHGWAADDGPGAAPPDGGPLTVRVHEPGAGDRAR